MTLHDPGRITAVLACVGCCVLLVGGCPTPTPTPTTPPTTFVQTNLVSDGSQSKTITDTNLVNPWGLVQAASGPFWVADNGTGVSTVYDGNGQPSPTGSPLIVTIPEVAGGTTPANPTGIVFNSAASSGDFGGNTFIFVTEDGTIAAWQESDGTDATVVVNNFVADTGPVYKGATLITNAVGSFLLVANFRGGTIDVFDKNFAPATLQGTFADTGIPGGFAPFNVLALNGKVYVSYAKQDTAKHDDVAGAGNGYVSEFDTSGVFQRRIASTGTLNSPWGMAIGPSTWGEFAGALIVGNFGDGKINAFSLGTTPAFVATLQDRHEADIVNAGLWSLVPGNGSESTSAQKLYLTAGGANEDHGLLASLEVFVDP